MHGQVARPGHAADTVRRGLYMVHRTRRYVYFARESSFLQRAGHCISKKPLDKDYLYEGVSQLLYSYLPGFRAHWVSAHSNLDRLVLDSIEYT